MKHLLLDVDTHFSDHFPELWADAALPGPIPAVRVEDGQTRLAIGDRLFPKPAGHGRGNPRGLGHLIGEGRDADRAVFMAEHGIGAAVLQPGFVGLSFQAVADPGERTAVAEHYNKLASRYCAESEVELYWAVLLSTEDPQWSAAELAKYDADPHAVAAVVRPTARTDRARLSDAAFTPVLEAAARQRMALFVHGGTGCYQWSPLAEAYEDYAMTHAFGHMGEHMIALTDLLCRPDGLPAGLAVVMLESGVGWIPAVLERLDSHVRRLTDGDGTPSALFAEHFAVVPDPGERHALWACRELGAARVLFGSDYPHWDTVHSDEWLKGFDDLCGADVVRANTVRLLPRLADAGKGFQQ